ncbi:lipoprotein lipase-like isoform X2 [Sinocyclocheilus anshuiensis]|uniref:lipoprotein lipase-like isoform X2 n=1 Tax=Sinocyclocheilus anshuiensis TaxID=1608454 RepID=UPI0007B81ACD|nr:PREDICTED: lipoprotein lipase-like isoform X2 [Sinocyclocheilus anshuiensis]
MLNGARQVRITNAQSLRRKDMNILSFQCVWWLVLSFTGLFVAALEKEIFSNELFDNFLEDLRDLSDVNKANVKFSLRNPSQPDDDVCYIVRGKPETLNSCNFKNTSKTFLVIHGWTVSGLFESWVEKLVAALYNREKDANVIVVDWLDTAQNHYVVAAQNTKMVGQETGLFIDWLEETARVPLEKLHLIGYSLGAHVAGFAGNHATNKVGRITGLDPAGPDFEGVHAHGRLSPDDAHFVDVLHTFTRGSLGLSIGIKQPVGHVDIYPNGGSFQPGCNMRGALEKIASYGILVFHYQLKINFLGKINQLAMEPALTVSLYGTNGEAEDLKLNIQEKITPNKTHSFLVVTEKDIGDLLMLKFKLEESTSSLLTLLSSWWYGDSANSGIQVHKIRVRVGETQKKIVLCLKDPQTGSSTQDVVFVKCKEPWRSLSKRPKLKSQ